MKNKKGVAIALVALLIAAAGVIFWQSNRGKADNSVSLKISGQITSISNGCYHDDTCSVTLDSSKTIITGCGLRADGTSCRSFDQSKVRTGEQVEAIVMKDKLGLYNLECDRCTIRAK